VCRPGSMSLLPNGPKGRAPGNPLQQQKALVAVAVSVCG
jgi:hypothetical protein